MGHETPDLYLQMIARHSGDSILVTDTGGLTEWANAAFERMSGFALEDCLGRKPGSVLQGPETDPETVVKIRAALSDRLPVRTEILNYSRAGSPYWIDLHITPVFDANGRHTHFISIERDISERKALEAARNEILSREKHRESERVLLSQVSEWLYAAKSQGELLMVVRRSMEVLMPEAEGGLYIYSNSRDVLERAVLWGDPDLPLAISPDACWALRRGRAYGYGLKAIEFPCEHAPEPVHPYFCIPILAHGEAIGLIQVVFSSLRLTCDRRDALSLFLRDRWNLALLAAEQISLAIANVRLRQELIDQSIRDPLTGLCNRRWLRNALAQALDRARAEGGLVSLVSIDLDHFKQVNDRFGHDAGDVVLREAARTMVAMVGARGEVCRPGGEEFVVLAPGLAHEAALDLAEDIRAALGLLAVSHDGAMMPRVSLSAGVATYPEDADSLVSLIKAGDRALYRAKNGGRDRVVSARSPAPGTLPAPIQQGG